MTDPLISVGQLRELLDTGEHVTLLDVRWRLGGPPGRPEHAAGHLPGAVYVDLDTELAGSRGVDGAGGRHPLPSAAAFQSAMRRAGVSSGRPVVVYDGWAGRAAGRAWWLLRFHGHDDVRILDGGWPAWVADDGRVETGPMTPTAGDFTAAPGAMPIVAAGDLTAVPVLVDARAAERYRGDLEPVDPVAGHVPGALNVPTSANLDADGRFLTVEQLREVYGDAGVLAGGDVAVYCGSGITAIHDLIALERIGVHAALYPGSWSDWISDPTRPVERG